MNDKEVHIRAEAGLAPAVASKGHQRSAFLGSVLETDVESLCEKQGTEKPIDEIGVPPGGEKT